MKSMCVIVLMTFKSPQQICAQLPKSKLSTPLSVNLIRNWQWQIVVFVCTNLRSNGLWCSNLHLTAVVAVLLERILQWQCIKTINNINILLLMILKQANMKYYSNLPFISWIYLFFIILTAHSSFPFLLLVLVCILTALRDVDFLDRPSSSASFHPALSTLVFLDSHTLIVFTFSISHFASLLLCYCILSYFFF